MGVSSHDYVLGTLGLRTMVVPAVRLEGPRCEALLGIQILAEVVRYAKGSKEAYYKAKVLYFYLRTHLNPRHGDADLLKVHRPARPQLVHNLLNPRRPALGARHHKHVPYPWPE